MVKRIIRITKFNFNPKGFTERGLVEYGKLRRVGVPRDKAIEKLKKEDKKVMRKLKFK